VVRSRGDKLAVIQQQVRVCGCWWMGARARHAFTPCASPHTHTNIRRWRASSRRWPRLLPASTRAPQHSQRCAAAAPAAGSAAAVTVTSRR
jgi:hypothetical protein